MPINEHNSCGFIVSGAMKYICRFSPATIAILAPAAVGAADLPGDGYGYGPGMMWGWGWPGMIFAPFMMILTIAVVIAVVVVVARWIGMPSHGGASLHYPPPGRTPVDILKERFARGEIDKDEFEERRRLLGD